jgi:hypothetical protein
MSRWGKVSEIKTARTIPMTQTLTLKQRLARWLLSPEHNQDTILSIDEDRLDIRQDTSIRFEVHNASGGRIVQTRRYDERKDRHFENLYIITSDKNFGEEIDKILTMETLRA